MRALSAWSESRAGVRCLYAERPVDTWSPCQHLPTGLNCVARAGGGAGRLADVMGERELARCAASGWAFVGGLAGVLLLAHPAVAQDSPLTLRLTASSSWDANVFRTSDAAPDPQLARGIAGRSDRIETASIGLRFNKTYSQQALMFDVSQTATRHDRFSFLDRDNIQYDGSWRWQLTPRISGALTTSRTQALLGFDETGGGQGIVLTTTTRGATLDGWLFGGWHLLAGATERRATNSQLFLSQPDTSQTGTDVGLRYQAASGSVLQFSRRTQRGTIRSQTVDLVAFFDSAFLHTENELTATWNVTGRSTLSGRLTRIRRTHEQVPQRDFSGTAGELRLAWTPTGRLSINSAVGRAIAPFAVGLSSNIRVDDSLSIAPAWRVSEKISARLGASRRVSKFDGAVAAGVGAPRRDVQIGLEAGATWSVHRTLTLGATLRHERRGSTDASLVYENRIGGLNAAFSF